MLLRPLRRLHRLLVPLQAAAMVAFAARLGWGHDPQCPHHAGAAVRRPATPPPVPAHTSHDAHTSHAAHLPGAGTHPNAGPDAPHHGGTEGECHCLDKGYCLGGTTALPQLSAGVALPEAPVRWIEPAPPIGTQPVYCDAYRAHWLPFPNAPPCTIDRS